MLEDIPTMLNLNGEPFSQEELDERRTEISALDSEDRRTYRNRDAQEIARTPASRVLIAAGPGTGKSYLFMDRIRHWLSQVAGRRIYVLTFVRKLVYDLQSEVNRSDLSATEKALITVSTLHSLARSLLERNHGTSQLPMGRHIRMIGPWLDVVWDDVLALSGATDVVGDYRSLEQQFHQAAPSEEDPWPELRGRYFELCRLYDAVGFAD